MTSREYQIALRCDDLGLDDVVVKDVEMFRMERMDNDHVWLACYLNDGQTSTSTSGWKARRSSTRLASCPTLFTRKVVVLAELAYSKSLESKTLTEKEGFEPSMELLPAPRLGWYPSGGSKA